MFYRNPYWQPHSSSVCSTNWKIACKFKVVFSDDVKVAGIDLERKAEVINASSRKWALLMSLTKCQVPTSAGDQIGNEADYVTGISKTRT